MAEHYASTLAMKQYTMVEADRVVKDALRASSKNRPMSVCGLPIQAFWAMTLAAAAGSGHLSGTENARERNRSH
ncbi:MAG: hypothetical protein ACLURV_11460 [Gallintestinimicrobium sp.]